MVYLNQQAWLNRLKSRCHYTPANFLSVANSSRPVALQRAKNFDDESLSRDEGLVNFVSTWLPDKKNKKKLYLSNSTIRPCSSSITCEGNLVLGKVSIEILTLS